MADFDSSLPVRTEAAGDVDVNISDATTPANKLKVNADGSIDTNFPAGSKIIITDGVQDLEINPDGSINVSATDLDIRNLTFATDAVNVTGSEVSLDAATLAALETITVEQGTSPWVVSATNLDIRDLVFATDKVDVSGSSVTVSATDLDIRDLVAATDSVSAHLFDEAGVAFSLTNPLPVEMVSDQSGDEVCSFNTSSEVLSNSSVNHDYTVSAGKILLADQVWASASGKIKVEVLINGVLTFVGFNSTSNPNVEIPMRKICKAGATEIVRVTITNKDKQSQDVYSTLTGIEV